MREKHRTIADKPGWYDPVPLNLSAILHYFSLTTKTASAGAAKSSAEQL
jgi:hypothetical protein